MQGSVHLFDRLPHVSAPPVRVRSVSLHSARTEPLIGLIRNPRSHRNKEHRALPTGDFRLLVEAPARRSELMAVLESFADQQIDYLAIDGGDGTVRDILTCGASVFGDHWPELILLPGGKTNALAYDLALPAQWSLEAALAAAARDRRVIRSPLVVSSRKDPDSRVYGFVFGAGTYTAAINLGQDAHRRGAFGAMAVALATLGTAWQALTGGSDNVWRNGTPMVIRGAEGEDLAHSHLGPANERYFMIASTLGTFPAGMKPFKGMEGTLRMAVLDRPAWRAIIRLPGFILGRLSKNPERHGMHRFGGELFTIDLGDAFILDGEAFPQGHYSLSVGPKLRFVVP